MSGGRWEWSGGKGGFEISSNGSNRDLFQCSVDTYSSKSQLHNNYHVSQ